MTYFPAGSTDDTADQILFTAVGGGPVKKETTPVIPGNEFTRNMVIDLQRALNRLAYLKGKSKISEDGKIGWKTAELTKLATGQNAPPSFVAVRLAEHLKTTLSAVKTAEALQPAPKNPKPTKPRRTSQTDQTDQPAGGGGGGGGGEASIFDSLKNMSTMTMAGLAVGAVALGFFLTRKPTGGS